MRLPLLLIPALLMTAAAEAQPISVNKGQWYVTQDMYYDASVNGEAIDLPPEHTAIDECWSLDEEVLIDESMVEMFEGCVSTGAVSHPFGLDIGLSCDFDGLELGGSAFFTVNHGRDSFAANLELASLAGDPVKFQSHIIMIGHRTGACQGPG